MPKNQKVDLYYDRMILALILGALTGFFIAYKLGNGYPVWITVCCAIAFGIETVTRVSKETKEANPREKMNLPSKGIMGPKPPKSKKLPKNYF